MSTSLDDKITAFVDALQAPISPDAPTGDDITYDDDFRTLKNTVDGLSDASTDLDLELLAEKSLELLTTKSKDLRVAGYFVVGQTQVHGTTGMAASLAGLRALLQSYWPDLYPPERRAAARTNALQFVADHLSAWIKRHTFTLEEMDAVATALEEGTRVQEMAMEKMGEHAPALSGFLSELDRAARRLDQRASEQAPPPPSDDADAPDPDAEAPHEPAASNEAPPSSAADDAPPPPPTTGNGLPAERLSSPPRKRPQRQ